MQFTWLDSNSWLLEGQGLRILIDPWLVGALVFGGATWLFQAERSTSRPLPSGIDLILLSQGLPDHAHPPTLQVLDRSIPVVASPRAARVCQELGYSHVHVLAHHQRIQIKDLTIEALPGALVGATLRENAYVLRFADRSIYYEPHGNHDPVVQQKSPIDIVITPVIDLLLPLFGAVIRGRESTLQLCTWLKPRFLLPTAAGGDLKVSGLLLKLLRAEGSVPEMQTKLREQGLDTIVVDVQPWQPFSL
ncbi:MAG: MBL fold metallo-hydrolase [Pseudanabaenaceae cyanobacterium SKYGB_i_bin29]|nr:MBL fold metallo-hydrolase [Pseudanabaenaceae cyanobacterium SKYG29]MDW8421397.1 MBL fold metallo-hydrolase [Pseudanabaenaceae cyanobacterium SKYGB_i_bin29]